MHFFGQIINILDWDMPRPTLYGWFHLLFFALSIIIGIVLVKKFKNPSEKVVRNVLLIISILSIALEIYKQFNYTFSYDGTKITADYQWYAFPFQFCSTPMYIGLVAGILGKGKVYDALCAYLATFSIFAGLCVMLYPVQVFISTIGINIQTMVCHGSMLTLGIFLLATGYVKTEFKTLLKAASVFAVCLVIAMIMNEIAHGSGLKETFNMFYISPYEEPSLPVYSIVQKYVPYPICTVIYICAFTLAAYLILLFTTLLKKLIKK